MPNIIHPILIVLALAAGAGVLLFLTWVKPQRQQLARLKSDIEAERERLTKDVETRQKELVLEAREEAHRLRDAVEQDNREKRTELQRLERKQAQKEEALEEK